MVILRAVLCCTCAVQIYIYDLQQKSSKSAVTRARFYYRKATVITSSLRQCRDSGHQQSHQRLWTAGRYFNQSVISGWLDWIVFHISSTTFPSRLSVHLPVHLVPPSVRPSNHPFWLDGEGLGTVVQTRHSFHSDPWREGGHWQFAQCHESLCSLLELTLNTADTPAWGMNTCVCAWGGGGVLSISAVYIPNTD